MAVFPDHSLKALCLGSGACKDADLEGAVARGVTAANGWTVFAVNRAAVDYPGHVDHFVTYHGEHLAKWLSARHSAGRPPPGDVWCAERRPAVTWMNVHRAPHWGGSSGLLAVSTAIYLGATSIVLCGIPIDFDQGHYYSPKVPWHDAKSYRKQWEDNKGRLANVRSMSGWTSELLGTPTLEWLAAARIRAMAAVEKAQ